MDRQDRQKDIRDSVAQVRDTEDLYRVYVRSWVTVYTTDAIGEDGIGEAHWAFKERYEGRVRDEDWEVYSHGPDWSALVKLRLPVMVGEFKYRDDAERLGEEYPSGSEVVTRNSVDDFRLREYSIKKLPTMGQG